MAKKKNYNIWKERIDKLKEIGGVPDITTREQLLEFLERIDAYLIMSDYTTIHRLLGKKYKEVKGELQESERYVLKLREAKELMDCSEWVKMRDEAYDNNFAMYGKRSGGKLNYSLKGKSTKAI